MGENIEKLVEYIEERGTEVDENMKKVLNYFDKKVIVYFYPSGFGHGPADMRILKCLCEKLNIEDREASRITSTLENMGLLGEERGIKSISGSEYIYGFTKRAEHIYKRR